MLRHFPEHVEDLARACFEQPIISETFTAEGPVEGGGTGSRRVVMNESKLTAWAKPAHAAINDTHIVGHEKIASDLGFRLGLPVAPVRINIGHGNAEFPQMVCISYAATGQAKPWHEGLKLTDAHKRVLVPVLSTMFVFSAWLCDNDHNWNNGNALLEIHDEDCCTPVFIDYSFCLQKHWTPPAKPTVAFGPRVGVNKLVTDDGIRAGIETIRQLETDEIRDIIARLPEECVARDRREDLISGLDERRSQIGSVLGVS